MTAVSAVIGNYNGESYLTECIETLQNQSRPPIEIVVVDASSTDRSVARALELGAKVVRRSNRGLGHLYNSGVAATKADLVFLANNDIALDSLCLEHLAGALDDQPSAFAADARQLDWSGSRTIHANTVLTRGRMTHEHLPGIHLEHNVPADNISSTVCANGAAMLVRRWMFDKLCGFDETFFMEWEDLDLCWRARSHGWPTLYVPTAVVRHHVGAVTDSSMQPRRSASSQHNLARFALKCLPVRTAVLVVFGQLLRLPAHPQAVTKGLAAVIPELPKILRERSKTNTSTRFLESMLEEIS